MTGTLFGLGVGPGDAELITLKALRILRAAPVIAYPTLEDASSLARAIVAEHVPAGRIEVPIRVPIIKARAPARAAYDRGAEALAEHLAAGRDVAVLCEGDPFFYGSFMYLYRRLAGRFPVRVVAGVSSLTAAAAVLGTPLAGRNDVLTIVPAPLSEARLAAALSACDAAAVIKVGRHLAKVRRVLDRLGLAREAWYVERATMAAEKAVPLSQATVAAAPYFSMILVHRRGRAWT